MVICAQVITRLTQVAPQPSLNKETKQTDNHPISTIPQSSRATPVDDVQLDLTRESSHRSSHSLHESSRDGLKGVEGVDLPKGWAMDRTPEGHVYYWDHRDCPQWTHPLPANWTVMHTSPYIHTYIHTLYISLSLAL